MKNKHGKEIVFKLFEMMINDKKVRINKEFRKNWENMIDGKLGQWFYILAINENLTVNIQSDNHNQFDNVYIENLIF